MEKGEAFFGVHGMHRRGQWRDAAAFVPSLSFPAHQNYSCPLTSSKTCFNARGPYSPVKRRRAHTCTAASTGSQDVMSVEARTMAWARVVVCGLNLCPFAETVLDSDSVRTKVSMATDEDGVKEALIGEIGRLLRTTPRELSTTLLVIPKFATRNFLRFHRLCVELEDSIESDERLVDEVMLACFHPEHEWGDSIDVDDAINYDKKAPYPTINLLRAREVDRYAREGKTQNILQKNQATLEEMGRERLKQLYKSFTDVEG